MKSKRGFLESDYRIFYLKEQQEVNYEAHYHDFHKIVIILSGILIYYIEGMGYQCEAGDVLIVRCHEVHKLEVSGLEVYERLVIYLDPKYVDSLSTNQTDMSVVFNEKEVSLLRVPQNNRGILERIIYVIKSTFDSCDYGVDVLRQAILTELIIEINSLFMVHEQNYNRNPIVYDKRIISTILFINNNIKESMTIGQLAEISYMSKYYLMRQFKKQTGRSIHQYMIDKRLVLFKELVERGAGYTEAAMEAGFGDYSVFLRAFKKRYKVSPRTYYDTLTNF